MDEPPHAQRDAKAMLDTLRRLLDELDVGKQNLTATVGLEFDGMGMTYRLMDDGALGAAYLVENLLEQEAAAQEDDDDGDDDDLRA